MGESAKGEGNRRIRESENRRIGESAGGWGAGRPGRPDGNVRAHMRSPAGCFQPPKGALLIESDGHAASGSPRGGLPSGGIAGRPGIGGGGPHPTPAALGPKALRAEACGGTPSPLPPGGRGEGAVHKCRFFSLRASWGRGGPWVGVKSPQRERPGSDDGGYDEIDSPAKATQQAGA